MFSPEGYVHWIDLVEEIYCWSDRIILANEHHSEGKPASDAFAPDFDPRATIMFRIHRDYRVMDYPRGSPEHRKELEGYKSQLDEYHLISELITHTCLAKIMLEMDTLVCSTSGQIMRAPEHLFLHQDRLDWCYWTWPIRATTEFSGYFKFFDEGKFPPGSIAERYCFIDPLTGLISMKNNSLSGFMSSYHFDVEAYELQSMVRRTVDPFLGHSIVWRNSEFPESLVEILLHIGAVSKEWGIDLASINSGQVNSKNRRRGPKPTGAREEYFRRYPEGKPSSISYEAISAELAEAGFPISARQIQNYEKQRKIS